MKTNLSSRFLRLLLVAGLSAAARAFAGDDGGTTTTVKLSAPDKPATLRVNLPWAEIRINGVDGDTVTVESTLSQQGTKETRGDGLRRLDDEVSFELTEHDNVVSLRLAGDNQWASHDAEFKISVPRTMALDIKTEAGGDLAVKNVEGDIEISNMNGEVSLEGITGSAVVNTMNGEVRAIYAKAPQKLVSITSMNGEVDLRVPADTKANVRLRTHNGTILTDFDEDTLKTKSENRSLSNEERRSLANTLIITVHPNGNYTIGTTSNPVSLDELTKAAEAAARYKDATVLVRTAENADLKPVTAAMDACRKAGLNKIRLQSGSFSNAAFGNIDTARISADAARVAADATRAAMQIAREVTEAVTREVENAAREESGTAPIPPIAPRAPRAPRPPTPPITGGKTVSGTLNGGGVDIKISTMNGEITLRQAK